MDCGGMPPPLWLHDGRVNRPRTFPCPRPLHRVGKAGTCPRSPRISRLPTDNSQMRPAERGRHISVKYHQSHPGGGTPHPTSGRMTVPPDHDEKMRSSEGQKEVANRPDCDRIDNRPGCRESQTKPRWLAGCKIARWQPGFSVVPGTGPAMGRCRDKRYKPACTSDATTEIQPFLQASHSALHLLIPPDYRILLCLFSFQIRNLFLHGS